MVGDRADVGEDEVRLAVGDRHARPWIDRRHQGDAIADRHRLLLVVGDVDGGQPRLPQALGDVVAKRQVLGTLRFSADARGVTFRPVFGYGKGVDSTNGGVDPLDPQEDGYQINVLVTREVTNLSGNLQKQGKLEDADLGMEEPGLNRVIRAGYDLLNLHTYFTAGPKEVRAWTVRVGATAPEAAGVIHTDFQKGFIRAEVIAYDDFIAYNGEQGAKDAGRWRLEGKDYIVKDGDVMHFRFNV